LFPAQLLVNDGMGEGLKWGEAARAQLSRPDLFD
jgi:hypothetical protein